MKIVNIKLSVIVTLVILIVTFILLVNQKMMQEIEDMQLEMESSSQTQNQKKIIRSEKTLETYAGSSLTSTNKTAESQKKSIKDSQEKKSKRVYSMPLDSPILNQ